MRFVSRALSCLLLTAPLAACGVALDFDPPDPDASAADLGAATDAGADAGTATDMSVDLGRDAALRDLGPDAAPGPCLGVVDGRTCTPDGGSGRLICIGGACIGSSCGDGFVDTVAGERCEPAMDPTCDPTTCRYQCELDTDCPAAPTICATSACVAHRCAYLPDATRDGDGCMRDTGATGTCRGGLCVTPGCGDGTVDPGEDCDPGTSTAVPGCVACHFLCRGDSMCADGDPCNGDEHCQGVTTGGVDGQLCVAGTPVSCTASDTCHDSTCVATSATGSTCAVTLLDGDGDGHASTTLGSCGDDCNDADPFVHPGAPEVCNGIDDNCNGLVDEGAMPVTWCFDGDGDGYGDPRLMTTSCAAPTGGGYVRDCTDCYDTTDPSTRDVAARVNPGQTAWFTMPYCVMTSPTGPSVCRFDYNCDTRDTMQNAGLVNCGLLSPLICSGSSGWVSMVPACGETGSWGMCVAPFIGLLCSTAVSSDVPQACH